MHKSLLSLIAFISTLSAAAQTSSATAQMQSAQTQPLPTASISVTEVKKANSWSPHLDLSLSAGTTGIGFELEMPVADFLGVRAGATFMPKFSYPLTFTAQIGDGDQMTADGLETRFERMAGMLEGFVGQEVDDKVDMLASPTMHQAKFMLDVKPFRNKNWHFSAGFFAGKPKIAQCINMPKETTSLFAINLYNRLYDNNGEFAMGFSLPPDLLMLVMYFGRAGFPVGKYAEDVVYQEDVWVHDDYMDIDYIEHAKGEVIHSKGDTYLMSPSNENTAYANAYVDKFRPYFGLGYSGNIDRHKRWRLGFDAGVMLWGGAPKLVDHAEVDLMYDVTDIAGQVGDYVNLARKAKAYPVIELKITHRLF